MFYEYRVSVQDDEKVLEMDTGVSYTTLQMYLILLSYTLKTSQMVGRPGGSVG